MNINIDSLDINELPKSFYFLITGRRRSGKTVLTEYLLNPSSGIIFWFLEWIGGCI